MLKVFLLSELIGWEWPIREVAIKDDLPQKDGPKRS